MRAWLTTDLIEEPIVEVEGDIDENDDECFSVAQVISATKTPWFYDGPAFHPRWHLTREDAVIHAKQLRDSRVKGIEKLLRKNPESKHRPQWEALIKQLNALTFEE